MGGERKTNGKSGDLTFSFPASRLCAEDSTDSKRIVKPSAVKNRPLLELRRDVLL